MEWIVTLICIVIVVIFWRIFLPLAVIVFVLAIIASIAIGGILAYAHYDNKEKERKREIAALEFRKKITVAQQNATPDGKEWVVYGDVDPASNKNIARTASIISNDGLCYLTVQKRLNGNELTGLDCPDIEIYSYSDIYVKFDTAELSEEMDLESYSDSDGVYIPSYQPSYSAKMSYKNFIDGLSTSNAVAIKIPSAHSFWVRFSLKGSATAISQLGQEMPSRGK